MKLFSPFLINLLNCQQGSNFSFNAVGGHSWGVSAVRAFPSGYIVSLTLSHSLSLSHFVSLSFLTYRRYPSRESAKIPLSLPFDSKFPFTTFRFSPRTSSSSQSFPAVAHATKPSSHPPSIPLTPLPNHQHYLRERISGYGPSTSRKGYVETHLLQTSISL